MSAVPSVSCSSGKSGPSVPREHATASIEERGFLPCIQFLDEAIKQGMSGNLNDLCLEHDLIKASTIWQRTPVPLQYNTEADVVEFVATALRDVAAAIAKPLGAVRQLKISHQLEVAGERADLWVMLCRGRPVGVVEVKKPGKDAMTNPHILGELYDYMMTLRCFEGLERVYGILTTYNEWRFCWLEDTDSDASSTEEPAVPAAADDDVLHAPPSLLSERVPSWPRVATKGCPDRSEKLPDNAMTRLPMSQPAAEGTDPEPELERKLFATRVIETSDTSLVTTLASVLMKMASSSSGSVDKLVDPQRRFRTANETQWSWRKLSPPKKGYRFDIPLATNVSTYSLVAPLGRGSSGRAYLAVGGSAACVLKFPLDATTATAESRKHEIQMWKTIWDASFVKEVILANEHVLVLPYVKTCQGTVDDQSEEVKEAARAAVSHILEKGYWHQDCEWRHVGLCYKAGRSKLHAVLIDLETVVEVPVGQKESARNEMLRRLQLL
jgi:hypothetical protein